MQTKLFDLPQSTIDEIIRLEVELMIPILAKSGITVTAEAMKSEIYKDQLQEIVALYLGENLAGWVRYNIKDNCIFVKSIQLKRETRGLGTLRGIFRETLHALKSIGATRIESVVQTANSQSLRLHEKLGFQKQSENAKAIRYVISVEVLKMKLRQILLAG